MLFLAAFVDSAAGGGGLISIPSYLIAGFPIHLAYGSNKFTSGASAVFSSVQYFRNGEVALFPVCWASAGALLGAWAGVRLALFLSDEALRALFLVLLPVVAVFIAFQQSKASAARPNPTMPTGKTAFLSLVIGAAIGVYEGVFGPGSGTLLILAFNMCLGLELLTACGSARAVNMAANVTAVLTFVAEGKVLWEVALPCALFSIAGGQLGTRLAIRQGARFVRPLMLVVVALLFARLLYNTAGL
jgi:uncharacterized membrane protein YfcA